jgi:hypothetical protein
MTKTLYWLQKTPERMVNGQCTIAEGDLKGEIYLIRLLSTHPDIVVFSGKPLSPEYGGPVPELEQLEEKNYTLANLMGWE